MPPHVRDREDDHIFAKHDVREHEWEIRQDETPDWRDVFNPGPWRPSLRGLLDGFECPASLFDKCLAETSSPLLVPFRRCGELGPHRVVKTSFHRWRLLTSRFTQAGAELIKHLTGISGLNLSGDDLIGSALQLFGPVGIRTRLR